MLIHDLVYRGKDDAVAVIDKERTFTYKDLQNSVKEYRNYLYNIGVRRGDRVGIFSRNNSDILLAYMAIVSLGALAVPINFQLSNREIAYIVKDAGIIHVLTYQELDIA